MGRILLFTVTVVVLSLSVLASEAKADREVPDEDMNNLERLLLRTYLEVNRDKIADKLEEKIQTRKERLGDSPARGMSLEDLLNWLNTGHPYRYPEYSQKKGDDNDDGDGSRESKVSESYSEDSYYSDKWENDGESDSYDDKRYYSDKRENDGESDLYDDKRDYSDKRENDGESDLYDDKRDYSDKRENDGESAVERFSQAKRAQTGSGITELEFLSRSLNIMQRLIRKEVTQLRKRNEI